MPPLVTRNTLWFYAADVPYVDFNYKGTQFFFNFTKSLTYCIPEGHNALWPGGTAAAREDGINLRVPEWSWWIIADDTIEFSCSSNGTLGNSLSFLDMTKGIHINIPVNVQQAKAIQTALEQMIANTPPDEKFVLDKSLEVLKPSYKVIAYPVNAYRWTSKTVRTSEVTYTPEWNPKV